MLSQQSQKGKTKKKCVLHYQERGTIGQCISVLVAHQNYVGAFRIPFQRLHPIQLNKYLCCPRYQYLLKFPSLIPMCNQGENQGYRADKRKIRSDFLTAFISLFSRSHFCCFQIKHSAMNLLVLKVLLPSQARVPIPGLLRTQVAVNLRTLLLKS